MNWRDSVPGAGLFFPRICERIFQLFPDHPRGHGGRTRREQCLVADRALACRRQYGRPRGHKGVRDARPADRCPVAAYGKVRLPRGRAHACGSANPVCELLLQGDSRSLNLIVRLWLSGRSMRKKRLGQELIEKKRISSITMLSRVLKDSVELRSAEGTESAPSHPPGLDRAEICSHAHQKFFLRRK